MLRKAVKEFYEVLKTLDVYEDYTLKVSMDYRDETYDIEVQENSFLHKQVSEIYWQAGNLTVGTLLFEKGYGTFGDKERAVEFVKEMTEDLKIQAEIDLKKDLEYFGITEIKLARA